MRKRLLAVGIMLLILLQAVMPSAAAKNANNVASVSENATEPSDEVISSDGSATQTDYSKYISANGGLSYGDGREIVLASAGIKLDETQKKQELSFSVEKAGWYALGFEYRSLGNKSGDHQIGIEIDGKHPYSALKQIDVPRVWRAGEIDVLEDGTQVRGDAVPDTDWSEFTVFDDTGLVTDPLMIYLSSGSHTMNFVWQDGSLELRNVTLFAFRGYEAYEEYKKNYDEKYTGEPFTIEAEAYTRANSLSVTAGTDFSSPKTTPYDYYGQLLNVMGGSNWQYTGQSVEWVVDAPESGLYNLTLRFKQSYKTNMMAYRKLRVNGKIPFAEANTLTFAYDGDWQYLQPEWSIYLNKGKNTISLEVTPGDAASLMNGVNDAVQRLNLIYRQILMLTGTSPDTYRDYHLDVEIPGIKEEFSALSKLMGELLDTVERLYGSTTAFSVLQDTERQLADMAANLRSVTQGGRLDRFKSNISSLASLGQSLREQPLQIDSITFSSPDNPVECEKEGFFAQMKHKWLRFLASFSDNYNTAIGSTEKDSITVWTSLGRDQLGILKSMTANNFEYKYGTKVNIQLVVGSLIQAVLAGKAPDIVLGQGETSVVDYAMRGAVEDLSKYEGFDEIMKRFSDGAANPFTYEGGVYAIPETQGYQMMFVRDDILADLGLETPKTWTDFITKIFPVLQRDNLVVGTGNLNNGGALSGIFLTLLYQYGGSLYSEDLLSSALTTPEALEAFDFAVSLYSEYGVPTQVDFLNRFRTGEMPIAIESYGAYNTLQVGAPEIAGLWSMVPIPGVEQEDGTINNTQIMTFSGTIMLADAKNKEACWDFINWWSSAETQRSFGIQQESVLGPSGRYTPANLEALEGLSWSTKQLEMLARQREVCTPLMHVPGSYYIGKSINSAMVTSVTDSSLIAREELMYWVELINLEMARKQKEFNFTGLKAQ